MFSNLRYVEGAIPGKKQKHKQTDNKEKTKKYEENRPTRKFNSKWMEGRSWLVFDELENNMKCSLCIEYGDSSSSTCNLKGQNKFLTRCTNYRISTIIDHEGCTSHKNSLKLSITKDATKKTSTCNLRTTNAGKALLALKTAERNRLVFLFRNAHAVMKHNRPISDYTWLCELDKAKGSDIGQTYLNNKASLDFIKSISNHESEKSKEMLDQSHFFSIMMDGSTDISGDEQEALYIRTSHLGKPIERFLSIGSPNSTRSIDLESFIMKVFDDNGINANKLVGLGSDGASNMTGKKGDLAALLKSNVNSELVNVHCFAHRLELAFRDVLKKNKKYEKVMTLLIGLHYFYKRSYNNKKGLLETISALGIKGVLPDKVTGTRWLPHLSRGIKGLLRTFLAYEAHLSSISHNNPKGEGLVKILLQKDVMCFVLFLQVSISFCVISIFPCKHFHKTTEYMISN